MRRLLHIAHHKADPRIWFSLFCNALSDLGELTIVEHGAELPLEERLRLIRSAQVLITSWGASPVPEEIAQDHGQLRYICNITGTVREFIPRAVIENGLLVSNWGEGPANMVAEGALTLLLAVLKDMHHQLMTLRRGGWRMDMHYHGGTLFNARLGIYGLGAIGRHFLSLVRPFQPEIRIYDPYLREMPEGCTRCESLEELFDFAQIVVIHAALTDETRESVTADLLARLPRHGVIINTARGGIIDQAALFRELEAGRLRAGLDVLQPDSLPEGHPAREWENLILSAHRIYEGWPDFNEPPRDLTPIQRICLENIRRHLDEQPILHRMDPTRYERST